MEAEVAAVENQPKIDKQGRAYATGKRKDAVARVWVKPGPGRIIVNGRDEEVYFARPVLRMILRQPLVAHGARRAIRRLVHGWRWRALGPGRCGAPRHFQGAARL